MTLSSLNLAKTNVISNEEKSYSMNGPAFVKREFFLVEHDFVFVDYDSKQQKNRMIKL